MIGVVTLKIMIIGSPGSGKSTYSRAISQRLTYPIFHLDYYWHQSDYSEAARLQLNRQQNKFMQEHDHCIIDGNYSSTMPDRMKQADLIIWLQVSRMTAIKRVIQRSLRQKWWHQSRIDMAENFSEHFDREYWQFLKFVWDYPRRNNQLIKANYQKYAANKALVILKNKSEKEQFLQDLMKLAKS